MRQGLSMYLGLVLLVAIGTRSHPKTLLRVVSAQAR